MGVLNPLGLLWLGLMVPVILLYLLRLRRREVTIASVLFWEQAVEDLQANAPFQRLRRNLLLYLQLAVIAVVAVAVARPFFRTRDLGGQQVIAILDSSASMAAVERGASRFEQAGRRIQRLIEDLGRGEELMLLQVADRAEVLHPFSGDRRSLARALRGARPLDRPTDFRDAIALAASLGRRQREGQAPPKIYLFSDGAVPDAEDLRVDVANVEFVPIGEPLANVGITALDTRPALGGDGRPEVLLAVCQSGGTGPREVSAELRIDGRLFDVRTLTVPADRPLARILDDLPSAAGLLEVRLETGDALAADDVAYVSLGSRRGSEVWLIGDGGLFLEKALALCPGARLVKVAPAAAQAAAGEGRIPPGTVLVFAGSAPSRPLPVPALYLNAAGPGAPVRRMGAVELPTIVDWDRQHPVTVDVDFGEVAVSKALRVTAEPGAMVLAEAADTPLIVAGERLGGRQVYVGFDFLDSDFPLRAGFPIFIANAIDWLIGGTAAEGAVALRAGDAVTLTLATDAAEALVRAPDGASFTVPVVDGRVSLGDLRRVGVYQVRAGEAGRDVAVSLLSRAESDLTPRSELRFGGVRVVAPQGGGRRDREYWQPLVWLALGLLLVEWWWFHRRG